MLMMHHFTSLHADDAALLDTALIFSRSLILGAATDFKKNNYN